MQISPPFIIGGVLFFLGALTFAAQLFGHGGVAKSKQFGVLSELLKGVHGPGPRRWLIISMLLMPMGACFLFAGVGMSNAERSERCEERCASEGYETARIGPNSDRVSGDRTTWFVACICEGGQPEALELDANELLNESRGGAR